MRPQEKRLMAVIAGAIVVGAVLGAGGYCFISRLYSGPASSVSDGSASGGTTASLTSAYIVPVSTTSSVIVATSSSSPVASFSSALPAAGQTGAAPATGSSAPVDMSDWKTYTNYELGFSFQYPPDLTLDTSNPSAAVLSFPSTYFSTAMADTDAFSATVSASCTPETSFNDALGSVPSQSADINGVVFTENVQEGSAAGSRIYHMIYQTNNNGVCYIVEYDSQGPDDPDDFTSNPSQAAAIETAHGNDAANVQAIVNSMVSTFTFVSTPAGENEADYAASQQTAAAPANSGNGLINLASVSTTTVSVGDNLVLTGSGFSGGDTLVLISNGSVQGVLWGGMPSSDTSITASIPAQACTQYVGSSGTQCPSYLILNPGIYTVSVTNQNGTTDPLYIRVQ